MIKAIRGLPHPGESRILNHDLLTKMLNDLTSHPQNTKIQYIQAGTSLDALWSWAPTSLNDSIHGLVLVKTPGWNLIIDPPFPIDLPSIGQNTSDFTLLKELLGRPRTIAIILLRLGRYAIGIVESHRLVVHKTGTRYVHGQHRAGGQSQRRFERNREQWITQLFDEVCGLAQKQFRGHRGQIDHLAFGGDQHVISRFKKRCPFLTEFSNKILRRRIHVEKPGLVSLERAALNLWGSKVYRSPQI